MTRVVQYSYSQLMPLSIFQDNVTLTLARCIRLVILLAGSIKSNYCKTHLMFYWILLVAIVAATVKIKSGSEVLEQTDLVNIYELTYPSHLALLTSLIASVSI